MKLYVLDRLLNLPVLIPFRQSSQSEYRLATRRNGERLARWVGLCTEQGGDCCEMHEERDDEETGGD